MTKLWQLNKLNQKRNDRAETKKYYTPVVYTIIGIFIRDHKGLNKSRILRRIMNTSSSKIKDTNFRIIYVT